MVYNKMITKLVHLLQEELNVDVPAFYHNQQNAARLDFEEADDLEARNVVKSVLQYLFEKRKLWLCAYGYDSGDLFKENHFFHRQPDTIVIPYLTSVNRDWFEYDHDTITVAVSPFEEFAVDRYLDYVFRLAFLSNTLVLASVERKVAVYVYDRRGMDVITTDALLIHEFMQHFQQYLYRS